MSTQPLDAHTPPSPSRHLAPPHHASTPALLCHFDHTHRPTSLPASLHQSKASSNHTQHSAPLPASQRQSNASSDRTQQPTPLSAAQCHCNASSEYRRSTPPHHA
ncbi:hypothetical protein Pcinc_015077 [Petrolisthes cinctipes]|uniref:Uncharacterized protein n=1 Tax=Petrolisthes cinctipes TaxID=88211 RepID=A0AAE1FTS8_PETCI|nr:hypothetical protein Pcinc_015077 [Petrolisthes cinctipes]